MRPHYYQPDGVDALVMRLDRPDPGDDDRMNGCRRSPLVLGHRDVAATRPASASCAAPTLLANTIASSMDEHARYGGVVPEVAARAHLEALTPDARRPRSPTPASTLADLDAIAVTSGPGLAGALMVGVGAAKALAVVARQAALRASTTSSGTSAPTCSTRRAGPATPSSCPTIALLVSGGHTSLLLVRDLVVRRRAARRDDRRRGGRGVRQGRPGARPAVSRAARRSTGSAVGGDPSAIRFPRGLTKPKDLERAPLRLLVLRAEDRGRPLGRAAAGRGRGRAGRGCRGRASARRSSTC